MRFIILFAIGLVTLVKAEGPYAPATSSISSTSDSQASAPYPAATYSQSDSSDSGKTTYSQSLDNPSYDPNAYSSFIPQDSVQQYVSGYGGPVSGGYGGAIGPVATGYSAGLNPAYLGAPGGFAVQTGYEGYLVPHIPPPPPSPFLGTAISFLRSILPFPGSIFSAVARIGSSILSSLGVILFGGAVTTLICTFTPFCTISFAALPFLRLKNNAKEITEKIGAEITPERVARAAEFMKTALEKYQKLQATNSNTDGQDAVESLNEVKK